MKAVSRNSFGAATLVVGAAMAVTPEAHGAVLAEYTLDNGNRTPTTLAAGVAATDFATPETNDIRPFSGNAIEDEGDFAAGNSSTQAELQTLAVSGGDYHEFTLSSANGTDLLEFDSFNLEHRFGGSSGVRGFLVRSSDDDFATYTDIGAFHKDSSSSTGTSTEVRSFDLSGLSPSSETAFRIYTYTNDPGRTQFLYNVSVEGSTVIPEPATAALLLPAMGALLGRRRRASRR